MARILVVDDQPHMTHIVAKTLGRIGHDVVRACDGADALERLRAEPFDLLISDVDMPRMDGLTLVRHRDVVDRLRAVVMLTGRCDFDDLGLEYCAEKIHSLPKPFSPSRLVQLIERLLLQDDSSIEATATV